MTDRYLLEAMRERDELLALLQRLYDREDVYLETSNVLAKYEERAREAMRAKIAIECDDMEDTGKLRGFARAVLKVADMLDDAGKTPKNRSITPEEARGMQDAASPTTSTDSENKP